MRANDGTGQRGHVTPKHVLVDDRAPGILLDWRVVEGGRWEAYVVWADGSSLPSRAHLEWVDQGRVKPRE